MQETLTKPTEHKLNKTKLKNFAVSARNKLIDAVKQTAYRYGFPDNIGAQELADGIIINGKAYDKHVKSLRFQTSLEIQKKSFDEVIEEVAYTWFNRFIALKFMEANGYLSYNYSFFTSANHLDTNINYIPDIVTNAHKANIGALDRNLILELQDKHAEEELFKQLIIEASHQLHQTMPDIFSSTKGDHTELLFPNNLLKVDSFLHDLSTMVPEDNWKQVEIIGWFYQFYINEKKAEVDKMKKSGKKLGRKEIPAATQLFTPHWVVQYMVENSLGKLYALNFRDTKLKSKSKWNYDSCSTESLENAR